MDVTYWRVTRSVRPHEPLVTAKYGEITLCDALTFSLLAIPVVNFTRKLTATAECVNAYYH
jgi:hypothetical protein